MQIPSDGGIGPVNFKRVQRFVAAGITRGFKLAEGAIDKVAVEDAGIVNGDFLFLAGGGMHSFLDEGLGNCGHVGDTAVEPDGCVDAVGQ